MQKKNLLVALVLAAMMLVQVSCTTYSYTSRSTHVNQTDINANKGVADVTIDYQKKITATSDFQKFINQAKQQAVYQCIMNNNIDVLIDPIFQIEQRGLAGYRATVTGFAGYYKVGKDGLDQVVEKKYSKEDIEKYLLLTDPDFYQHYYKTNGCGNVYNIKCDNKTAKNATVQSDVISIKAKAKKPASRQESFKKAKQLRDAGIAFTATGLMCPIGLPMLIIGQKRMNQNR